MERNQNGTGEFQRLRQGTAATSAELQEFMQGLRGRSPQEMLGVIAQSGLTQGLVLATLGTAVLLAVFTAGPYAWSKMSPPAPKTAKQPEAPAEQPAAAATTPAPATEQAAPTPDAERTLEVLGESEVKTSDPNKNPLDNLDNLLDLE